jgi:hypothetical protein
VTHLRKLVRAAIVALLCSIALPAAAGDGPLTKLREDLAIAIRNANLTDSQKRTLDDATSRLREAAQSKQSGGKVDRKSVKKALSDIRKIAESGAFQPSDLAAIKADLDTLRDAGGRSRRGVLRR